jgi:hypothetical protein
LVARLVFAFVSFSLFLHLSPFHPCK